jgi:integrase
MAELRARDGVAAMALEFAILCASRTDEVLGSTWGEFDLDARKWVIPARRMKGGYEHIVPLSDRALEILRAAPRETGNKHAFIGGKAGKGLTINTLLKVTQAMNADRERAGKARFIDPKQNDRDVVPHGIARSTFKDWCTDCTSFDDGLSEAALAHRVKGVRGAYARSDRFEARIPLMQAWGSYCTGAPIGDTVVPFLRKAQ